MFGIGIGSVARIPLRVAGQGARAAGQAATKADGKGSFNGPSTKLAGFVFGVIAFTALFIFTAWLFRPAPVTHVYNVPDTSLQQQGALPTDVTCQGLHRDLSTVLADLKNSTSEAWTTGGHEGDLQALADDTQPAGNGTTVLDGYAATFSSDATAYIAQNYPVLAPGWQAEYTQVTADANVLAGYCQQAKVAP